MSKKETPKESVSVETTSKSKGSINLTVLVISLSVVVAGMGVIYQLEQTRSSNQSGEIIALQEKIQQLEDTFSEKIDKSVRHLSSASDHSAKLNGLYQGQQAEIEQLKQHVSEDLEAKVINIENRMERLKKIAENTQSDPQDVWVLSELASVAHLASMRLEVMKDAQTSLALLNYADKRLQGLNDAKFRPLRKAIATDVAKLSGVLQPDVEGIWVKLEALSQEVESLPFKKPKVVKTIDADVSEVKDTAESQVSGWRESLNQSLHELKDLVKIRKHSIKEWQHVSFDDAETIRRQLQLMLEQTRLALVREQEVLYQDILRAANKTIDEYFDLTDQRVISMKQMLNELDTLTIKPKLPEKLTMLDELQALSDSGA